MQNWTSNWSQFNPKNYEVISVRQISSTVPENFNLKQNYPNPFNPSRNWNLGFQIPDLFR
ncbi:MAG: hypothetical protein IPL16_00275 [Ignavibacteria bacterium]|nr:hypothetical protein [Ignavibacteria bacterium]